MAMHSAVLLAEENKQLQTANERQKRKRARRRTYIAIGGILTVKEGLDRSQITNTISVSRVTDKAPKPRIYALLKYNIYKSLKYIAYICPNREASN